MCWQRRDRVHWSQQAETWARPPRDRRSDTTAAARRTDLRVSDADRQAVIDDLRQHTGDGRLTLDEFEERVERVLQARTDAELHIVTQDLPSLRPASSSPRPGFRFPIRPGVIAAGLVVLLLVAGHWWVLIPVGFFVFGGCGSHARHVPARRHEDRDESMTYA